METSHVSALMLKHEGLERKIQEELNHCPPNQVMIQTLKRRKLKIKDELAHC